MRLLVFFISSVIGGIVTAGIAPQAQIFGLQPDLLLIVMLSCVILDETPVPIIFTCITTIVIDMFYTGAIGVYTIPYAVVLFLALGILKGRKRDRVVVPVAACAAAWLVKDLLNAATVFLNGNVFNFWKIFISLTLPETLLNCIIMLAVFQIYYAIFEGRKRTAPKGGRVEIPLNERRNYYILKRNR